MNNGYIEYEYIEEDYYEDEKMPVTPLPSPPLRSDAPAVFVEKADTFLSAFPQFALELDAVTKAMNNNSTNSTSTTSQTIANSGSLVFSVQPGKGYLPGHTVKAAYTLDGTIWMQGDVTAYDFTSGLLTITMNAKQGSGTYTDWTLSLATSAASSPGSLSQDYAVKSLTHAIGTPIVSASTIDLSAVTGNTVHVTASNTISAATMTAGKDVCVIFDGIPALVHHATNHKLNANGANVTVEVGDMGLYSYDGTTVRVVIVKKNGKALVETAAPAGTPVGSGLVHFGSSAPTNYLVCPTSQTNINRTTFATLFAAIGTTWGVGDSSTTFGMPWFAANYAILQANSNVGTATAGDNLAHTHTYSDVDNTGTPAGGTYFTGSIGSLVTKTSSSSGGSANLAAGSRVLICVRYQ